jgi:hypothetical protein
LQLPKDDAFDVVTVRPTAITNFDIETQADEDARAVSAGGNAGASVSADLKAGTLHIEAAGEREPGKGKRVPVAWAKYNNTVDKNGWSYLYIGATDDKRISDDLKMYAAGFLEGLLSAKQIRDFQHNANLLMQHDEDKHHALGNIRELFKAEVNGIRNNSNMVAGHTLTADNAPKENWWRHARYALLQTWGTMDAYNRQVDVVGGTPMSLADMIILSSDGETPDLEMAYDREEALLRESQKEDAANGVGPDAPEAKIPGVFLQRSSTEQHAGPRQLHREEQLQRLNDKEWRHIKESTGRCSALVRLAADNKDLLVGHTTFSDYSEMTRVFKYYDLPLEGSAVRRMGFSSYPGVAGSTDDYYLLDSGLVVTETTVSMLTDEAYDKLDDSGSKVPDFMRIMLANRLAKSGDQWSEYMKRSASGTYSSQWMIVDYNKFTAGQPLHAGALTVLEQVPGLSHSADMTVQLQTDGFWASENRAALKDIRDQMGATEAEQLHGRLFSANENPRAHIFQATAPKVNAIGEMRHEMQRNQWPKEVDGGQDNTPDHAISARGDLDTQNPNPNGGVDSKVTNSCMARKLQCNAISGPTHDGQKPFRWKDEAGKELFPDDPHDGQPNVWNFDWVRMGPEGELGIADGSCGQLKH